MSFNIKWHIYTSVISWCSARHKLPRRTRTHWQYMPTRVRAQRPSTMAWPSSFVVQCGCNNLWICISRNKAKNKCTVCFDFVLDWSNTTENHSDLQHCTFVLVSCVCKFNVRAHSPLSRTLTYGCPPRALPRPHVNLSSFVALCNDNSSIWAHCVIIVVFENIR